MSTLIDNINKLENILVNKKPFKKFGRNFLKTRTKPKFEEYVS